MTITPTDEELATAIRNAFDILREAIRNAEKTGLCVEIGWRIKELSTYPEIVINSKDISIVRPL